jgi:hypothetical protein
MTARTRGFLFAIGTVFILLLGWLTGYLISSQPYTPTVTLVENEKSQLEQDLTQYIAEKLKTEKKDATLQRIVLMPAVQEAAGMLRVPYTVVFDDLVEGESTTSLVQATALLKKVQDAWRVTQVLTEKETVTYNTAALVTRGETGGDTSAVDPGSDSATQAAPESGQ